MDHAWRYAALQFTMLDILNPFNSSTPFTPYKPIKEYYHYQS